MAADNNDFTHEFVVYNSDNNNGTQGTGKFLLYDDNINAIKLESIDNIKIGGGSEGRVLATDGEGNLSWVSVAAVSGGVSSYNDLTNLPNLSIYAQTANLATVATSGSYNDLTDKPSIPTVPTDISAFNNDSGYITLAEVPTPSAISSGNTAPGSAVVANDTNVSINFSDGGSGKFIFNANGQLQLPNGGDIVDSAGASVLGGSSGPTNEITNTDGISTYSVSVGTNGVVTMTTARGGIEFGALPEEGAPNHLHIMRPAGQEGSSDLYFGDDYNYVKMPSSSYSQQGVEIGSSLNQGAVSTWRFGTDGHLILPAGGDIRDITGTSVLGVGGSANTGNISFSGDEITGTAGVAKMQVLDVIQTASYSFTPGVDYSTAVWENDYIVFNDPTQAIYDAIWALTNVSTIQVQVSGNWTTVTSTGSSTPGMPLAPTLFINQTAVGGPLNIDIVDITINQGTTSYVEIDGTDFRVDVQDDIRMYANDAFRFINRSTTNGIEIQTADGDHIWEFNPDGTLTLPNSGDILRNGNSVIPNLATVATTGNYNDLDYKPDLSTKEITHESNVLAGPTNTGDGSSIQITDDYQTEKVLISNLFGDVARATLPNVSGYGKIVILVTSSPQATYVDRGRWNGSIGYVSVSNSSNGVVILMSLGSNGWKQIQTND